MSVSQTYVVTGCNRGLGLGFTTQLLAKGHQVIGTCRHPDREAALGKLEKTYGAKFSVAELDIDNPLSLQAFTKAMANVAKVDVLITNAGVNAGYNDKLHNMEFDAIEQTFRTNTIGPMRVTKALLSWLDKSDMPRIVHISSLMGSIADNKGGGAYAYRMSKTALNMFMKCFSIEYDRATHIAMHPGWVQTDMGGTKAPLTVDESVSGMVRVISELTKKESGKFMDYKGETLPW